MQFQIFKAPGVDHQGFQMTFGNGYMVSIVWGTTSMSGGDGARLAEVAVFDPEGVQQGEPQTWQTPERIVAIMVDVAALN